MNEREYQYQYPNFGRPGTEVARIRHAALAEVERRRDPDTGKARTIVRFVYYRLVVARVVVKDAEAASKKKPSQKVSEALTWLRERALVGWDEIVDASREVIDAIGWPSMDEALEAAVRAWRRDPWDGDWPVLVVESKSLADFFRDVAYKYRIPLVPLGGQGSGGFLANDVCDYLDGDTEVLFVGDWDKSGRDIENSAEVRLRSFVPEWCGKWTRLAVTDEQAERYRDLIIMKADGRERGDVKRPTLEAEAIDQDELLGIVTDALDERFPTTYAALETGDAQARATELRRLARRKATP